MIAELVHEIIKEIKLGDKEGLKEAFKSCKKHFSASNISLQKYRIFIISLIAEITRFGNNNQLNMEQAVELLMTTGDKTYIIAEKVGYADPNYFSYALRIILEICVVFRMPCIIQ